MTIRTASIRDERAHLRKRLQKLWKAAKRGKGIWFRPSIPFDRFDFFWYDYGVLESTYFSGDEMLGRVFTHHLWKYRDEGSTWRRIPKTVEV